MLNRSIVSGITGFVVANGYFTTTLLPIVSKDILSVNRSKKAKYTSIVLLIIGGITIFMIQQRMAFALFLLYIFSLGLLKQNRLILLFTIIFSLTIYTFGPTNYDIDMGRLVTDNISQDSRMNQFNNFIYFFNSEYFLWGADLDISSIGNSMGHNTLMDSLRRGGFFTFVIYSILFFLILVKCIINATIAYRNNFSFTLATSISCIIFLVYSFTHSTGIQSGAINFWLTYSLMGLSILYEKNRMPN